MTSTTATGTRNLLDQIAAMTATAVRPAVVPVTTAPAARVTDAQAREHRYHTSNAVGR